VEVKRACYVGTDSGLQDVVGKDSAKVGSGNAFKNKWIKKDGDSLVLVADEVKDTTKEILKNIQETKSLSDAKLLADLKKRKLVTVTKIISYIVSKGEKYAKEIPVEVTDLTAEMLASGEWETANFKPYNFNALGAAQNAGALHRMWPIILALCLAVRANPSSSSEQGQARVQKYLLQPGLR
jgi:phenylalanyl-tRNA synthetase alpha chain